MAEINQLELQKKLFGNNHHFKKDVRSHKIIVANVRYIKHLAKHAYSHREIAKSLNVPTARISQYMKYHHIYCVPKTNYYQHHMKSIISALRKYHTLSRTARKLNLDYGPLYIAWENYNNGTAMKTSLQKPKHSTSTDNLVKNILDHLKNNESNIQYYKNQCNYYKKHYQIINTKYKTLINKLKAYIN